MEISAEQYNTKQPVVMYQRWEELLFLHWSFDPAVIQRTLPPGLTVDTFDDRAWVGVVPFFMSGVRPRFLPAVPGISGFQELNLRTYVVDGQGRAGVWFYSLDTSHRMPVWIARKFFHLNYRFARMRAERSKQGIQYVSERRLRGEWDQRQAFEWSRTGAARPAERGSLDHFLVERYRLFSYNAQRKQLYSGRVSHVPYPVQDVKLGLFSTQLFDLNDLAAPDRAPESSLASAGVSVQIYPLSRM